LNESDGLNELALFAGAGGGILGGKLLGWRTVCAVERDAYAAQVLAQRQNDGILEAFPIWSDVCSFDGKPWRGIVDVVSGGFPCQDISAAGKGAGIEGERSGMWKEMARIIGEVRPEYAFVENSPMLTTRGLGTVLADLASLGFDAEWGVLSAADVGANHERQRIWLLARQRNFLSHAEHNRDGWGEQFSQGIKKENNMANANVSQQQRERKSIGILEGLARFRDSSFMVSNTSSIGQSRQRQYEQSINTAQNENGQANNVISIGGFEQWVTEPKLGRVANGLAYRMDRLKAIGNGQVPLCAATAFELLRERIDNAP
jgi:DNA (cytosine-5)-methyltransferase 1